ncbi:hypothetical protein SLEP1_g47083 [Rubroshorea leprosula]|uniref:WIT1/2 N-terminal helical bundle domain-containing protein n=1 Tax=Rubroshorea leprosula TaxID=152421 RepID=A0AAV5LQ33_9ROSI|nr:hypothetical protein SLEP1_g47083 [Rubroshorea leprosula]
MGTADFAVGNVYANNLESEHEEVSSSGERIQEMQSTMILLNRADMDLAYSSEKLANLHVLLMLLLGWDDDPEVMSLENNDMSAKFIENALVFDLLSGILDSELREVESFLDTLKEEIVDARHKISSGRHFRELFLIMGEKLRDSEESLRQCQERVLEVKMHLIKFQRSISYFRPANCNNDEALDISANALPSDINGKLKEQTAEQQRYILRMLEKSLARELDLEKKLSVLGQNEEQVKLKLHYTEQVASRMEEAAEVVWGRFLEADNAAEVLMGISKELLGRLQVAQFNLNGSIQREAELKSKFQVCMEELNAKNLVLQKLESSNVEQVAIVSEVFDLREKVILLEEQLKQSEFQLKDASDCNEVSQEQLHEMESVIESLKDNIYEAESRAESAQAKVTELTDANLELNEELNLLKSNDENKTNKVASLEKQSHELENQLQHAKASSEASQEQMNMLYSAILDMETLISDLNSKVSKAESKTEEVEEQCIELSESNFTLNEEISILRGKIQCLEASLDQANDAKEARAKEINHRTKIIMDMVLKLSTERERIQKQLCSVTNENELLMEKLQSVERKNTSRTMCDIEDADDKGLLFSKDDSTKATHSKMCNEAVSSATTAQAGG